MWHTLAPRRSRRRQTARARRLDPLASIRPLRTTWPGGVVHGRGLRSLTRPLGWMIRANALKPVLSKEALSRPLWRHETRACAGHTAWTDSYYHQHHRLSVGSTSYDRDPHVRGLQRNPPSSSIDPENCAAHSVSIAVALGVWRVVRDAPDGASSDGNNEGAKPEKKFSVRFRRPRTAAYFLRMFSVFRA